MADVHLIETPTHGRVLVDRPSVSPTAVLVGCHGYAQTAEILLDELLMIRGDAPWTLVSVQALHRFYTKGDRDVVASWMTRQDRDTAIADNIAYLDRVFDHLDLPSGAVRPPVCVLGFSQGVAMAYRAALRGAHAVAGLIAVGGDVPPDVQDVPAARWPRVLIAAGDTDYWYTPDKVAADATFLASHAVRHEILRYPAGHVFTDEVRAAARGFVTAAQL